MHPEEITRINQQFEHSHPTEILTWAWEEFEEQVVVTSSFQTQSLPLLHLISRATPQIAILFLDTGYHFPQTLEFRDRLIQEWGLNVRNIRASVDQNTQAIQQNDLYQKDPDLCCYINKVEPLQKALQPMAAWISGIRRDQTQTRKAASPLEIQPNGKIKINPMLNWTKAQVQRYIVENNLPHHPLSDQGYSSIGCAPCTRPVVAGEDERAGRWPGQAKDECGIHLPGEVSARPTFLLTIDK